jgi:ribose 1,5-bisphosphate isomerase
MVVSDTAEKIKKMEIRGAGRIARAAVAALMDHAASATARDAASFRNDMREAAALLQGTRPTAVSLPNAIHRVMRSLEGILPPSRRWITLSLHAGTYLLFCGD